MHISSIHSIVHIHETDMISLITAMRSQQISSQLCSPFLVNSILAIASVSRTDRWVISTSTC